MNSKLLVQKIVSVTVVLFVVLAAFVGTPPTLIVNAQANDAQAYLEAAKLYLENGEYAEALINFTKAIEMDRWSIEAYLGRATTFEKLGKNSQAIIDVDTALAIAPNAPEVRIHRAFLLEKIGKNADALQELNTLLESGTQTADMLAARGIFYFRQFMLTQAQEDFDAALDLDPNNVTARFGKAVLWHFSGSENVAEENCVFIFLQAPNSSYAALCESEMSLNEGDYVAALETMGTLLEKDNTFVEGYLLRALLQISVPPISNYELAHADLSRSIFLNQGCAACYAVRGLMFQFQGTTDKVELQKSLADLKKAVELSPEISSDITRAIEILEERLASSS